MRRIGAAIAASVVFFWLSDGAWADARPEEIVKQVRLTEKLNGLVPGELEFLDDKGHRVRLKEYFGKRPVALVMVYYECPMLCSLLLNGLVRGMNALPYKVGEQVEIVAVSVSPRESPQAASKKKARYANLYNGKKFDAGAHFLTGKKADIDALAEALGIRYAYDARRGEYAHPAAVVLLTPEGRISRYLHGIEFPPRNLRLAVVEAAGGRVGTLSDRIMMLCYQYDPQKGRYSLMIHRILQVAGSATAVGLGAFLFVILRRERRA